MKIGIVGAGNIGGTLAKRLTQLGHQVTIANSRGPDTLGEVAARTGATPGTVEQALHGQELVIVAIAQKAVPGLPKALFAALPPGLPVVDTGNYYLRRDGALPEIDAGLPESRWVEKHLGHPVIKVFNTIYWAQIEALAKPAGTPGRVALPVAGDDPGAKRRVLALVDALGFDALDAGSIDDSWKQQPGAPIHALYTDLARAREALTAARLDEVTENRVRATSNADLPPTMNRRTFLAAGVTAAAATLTSELVKGEPPSTPTAFTSPPGSFWPNGARMAVSLSLMFEAGGQPISGAGGFFAEPIQAGLPDLPTNALFAYGYTEGIPRLLDLMDKHDIKLSSFMIGQAVENHPEMAREIVRRGHEAAAHGRTWENSYNLPPDQERRFISDSVDTIRRVTGQQPIGWNAYYLRNSVHTLEILQDLGFVYHIDDPSRDEPFITPLRGKDFVTVPYTYHMNDLVLPQFAGYDPAAYVQALTDEFDQLYAEAATRRRMMVIGLHDRVSGHAARVRALDRFLTYARGHKDVWFARKDEIARWALQTRSQTPVVERGPVAITGLPGPN